MATQLAQLQSLASLVDLLRCSVEPLLFLWSGQNAASVLIRKLVQT